MSTSAYIKRDPVNIPSIPRSIDDLPFWGVWKFNAEERKVAFNPRTGQAARSNDSTTFGTRAEAERAFATGRYRGLCVLVDESLGITMLDFDEVIPEDRAFDEAAIPPRVRRVMRMTGSPFWWTQSGCGLRSFVAATTGQTFKNKNGGKNGIIAEQYTRLRFATVMLDRQIDGTPDTFNTDVDDLVAVIEALGFPEREQDQPAAPRPAYSGGSRSNEEIIETASRVNGAKFRRLHEGDISGYPESQTDKGFSSEADGAYVLTLCGYTGDDAQVADIWRSESRLYRKKLDRPGYVDLTIQSARRTQSWWYDWDRSAGPTLITGVGPTQHHASGHENGGNSGPEAQGGGDTCPAQLAVAQRRIRQLEAAVADRDDTIATLRERVRMSDEREAIQRNTKLGSARQTAAVLPSLFRSERPREPASETPYRMPLAKLAERTGLSEDTCSKHLKQLATYRTGDGAPVLHTETREIPFSVNQSTGEITTQHREVWIGSGVEPSAFGYVLAALTPDSAPKHGGAPDRNACPDHPFAGVIRRTKTTRKVTRECAHCNTILNVTVVPIGTPTAEFIPASPPIQQDAFGHESDDPSQQPPMPQHAASTTNHTRDENLSSKMRHSPLPSEEHPSGSWNGRDGVAGDDTWTNAGWRAA